jgi:hypothetical protein
VITILECGRFAHAALSSGPGEVCAVFRRSVYLRYAKDRYACLGDATLGRGPLNALVADAGALGSLALGAQIRIPGGWPQPSPPRRRRRALQPRALADNLRSLALAARSRAREQGLGRSIAGGDAPLLRHARPALQALDDWLARGFGRVPAAVHALLGLGPGLTPSGDDYLGGALVALRALGEDAAAGALWRAIRARAAGRTHAISLAHLSAAAAGEAHEAVHGCLEELLAPRAARWEAPLARLDRVGHCSGWDGLAGAVAVARRALR